MVIFPNFFCQYQSSLSTEKSETKGAIYVCLGPKVGDCAGVGGISLSCIPGSAASVLPHALINSGKYMNKKAGIVNRSEV